MLLTRSCPDILVRIACDSALIGLVQVLRKPRIFLFPTQPCAHRVLGSELSEVVTASVEDRGQAEGRKDAGCLAQPHYNDTLLKHHLDFFSLGELVESLIYFLVNS